MSDGDRALLQRASEALTEMPGWISARTMSYDDIDRAWSLHKRGLLDPVLVAGFLGVGYRITDAGQAALAAAEPR